MALSQKLCCFSEHLLHTTRTVTFVLRGLVHVSTHFMLSKFCFSLLILLFLLCFFCCLFLHIHTDSSADPHCWYTASYCMFIKHILCILNRLFSHRADWSNRANLWKVIVLCKKHGSRSSSAFIRMILIIFPASLGGLAQHLVICYLLYFPQPQHDFLIPL